MARVGLVTRTKFGRSIFEGLVRAQAAVAAHRLERFVSEDAERAARCEMALDVEGVLDGGMKGQKALG
jgi:hypothetical protein